MSIARRIWLTSMALLVLVVLGACEEAAPPKVPVAAAKASKPVGPVAASEEDLAVPIFTEDPVRGSRFAPVTIVTFSDFQCPYCSRLAATLERVRETYGDDVRIVFKNDPLSFHDHARLAAEVGVAVNQLYGPEAFWRYHDLAFHRQQLIGEDTIRAWAVAAGADARVLDHGIDRGMWSSKVKKDQALALKLGVDGTPMSFVNGIEVPGAQPFDTWKQVVDAMLTQAKALAASGVPRDQIYAKAVAQGFEEPKEKAAASEEPEEKPDTAVWRVPVAGSPVRGNPNALVTIVEFSDFQCPYCKMVEPTLKRIATEYGDRVRLVWKDLPLGSHDHALPAAEAARAARAQKGDAGFWAFHDQLFAGSALEENDLEAAAKSAGLDGKQVLAAVHARTFAKQIAVDATLADDVNAVGTPHFFVNGKRIVGAESFETFKTLIDAELANAESLAKKGTPQASVYDAIIKNGEHAADPARLTVAPSAVSAPFRGAPNGKVVIQEFSDFQCPFCGRAEPTIDQLLTDYPTQVKVIWRNMPLSFHDHAELAAEAAREAFVQKGNEGFSKMRSLLFQHQRDSSGLDRPALEGYAAEVGLDAAKFKAALDNHTHRQAIEADIKAASDAGINGTPAFTIGPYGLSGAQPVEKFKRLVERVLAEP